MGVLAHTLHHDIRKAFDSCRELLSINSLEVNHAAILQVQQYSALNSARASFCAAWEK